MKKLVLIAFLIIPLLHSCKPDPVDPDNGPTSREMARDGLYDLMKYVYLWYDRMPTVKASNYAGPEEILEVLRYRDLDHWSFVADYDAFMASMQGSFVGHGIQLALDDNNNVRVVTLYHGSDLWPQGVRRGWIVSEVNGTPLAPIFISGNSNAYNTLMGPSTAGITNSFRFIKPDGGVVTFSSTKASFTINSVTATSTFDLPTGKTGYLCFETFIEPSEQELNEAFALFKAENITDLIIDLRYNTGGYMNIAQQLSSLVISIDDTSKVCYKLTYNQLIGPEWNESEKFIPTDSPLGLNRVIFITTRSTASASEVVINSLDPWIDVRLVGDTTHGKPAGMNLWGFPFPSAGQPNPRYSYVFAPITFEYLNANDNGRFYDGIAPDVLAEDDITHDFGDPEEASLKAAINLLLGLKSAPTLPVRHTDVWREGSQLPTELFLGPPQQFLQ